VWGEHSVRLVCQTEHRGWAGLSHTKAPHLVATKRVEHVPDRRAQEEQDGRGQDALEELCAGAAAHIQVVSS
jgi:hypothetical protein